MLQENTEEFIGVKRVVSTSGDKILDEKVKQNYTILELATILHLYTVY